MKKFIDNVIYFIKHISIYVIAGLALLIGIIETILEAIGIEITISDTLAKIILIICAIPSGLYLLYWLGNIAGLIFQFLDSIFGDSDEKE